MSGWLFERLGKIKCEATEGLACAVALLLFLFCRSDSQTALPKSF